ncbi:pyridoxamine 5'-phosphate oxidase family protein [Streptomyces sp. ET3-23]|uniref:pyridoxamine 5'-phosphate oxidase family protein n=1 Tax=Streptomyces sp. ET3-23 TaxID=2885643 RepID=UPI001D1013AA|nr:pyridoxamine 5'-phosphate oxidase family protein [Streptomyces sp. ET3-23]MCC2274779.1 pyridoxamine 5'-phosphate oxidase family protein [Streptomyces sp. ET3-23]
MMPTPAEPPRPVAQRREDVLALLETERHLWLASADADRPHLVPFAYAWDGECLTILTRRTSRTVRNLQGSGLARVALGTARDVVLVDAAPEFIEPEEADERTSALFASLPMDPRRVPGVIGVRLRPRRILAWRSLSEMRDRVVMRDGHWVG